MAHKDSRTQEVQSVLFIMGFPLGKTGIDGERGPITTASMMGAFAAGNVREMEEGLLKKMKDPEWRAAALEKLKNQPQTKDSIIAQQWLLKEAGTDRPGMRDSLTGLMSGKMDEATQTALSHTTGGRPNASAYAAYNVPESATQYALNKSIGEPFKAAASGIMVAAVSPTVMPTVAPKFER